MPTKKQIEKALLDSLERYEKNVREFPYRQSILNKRIWFKLNCLSNKCPLCKILRFKNKGGQCLGCPLNDKGPECCVEWQTASIVINLSKYYIEAIRDRIKLECERRGLL